MPEVKNDFEFDTSFDAEVDAEPEVPVTPAKKPALVGAGNLPQDAEKGGKDAPQHNPMTLHFAKEFGFSEAEIADLSPKELDAAVRAAHRTLLKTSADFRRNEIKGNGGDKPPAPPSETRVEPAPAPKPEEDEYDEFKEDLHPRVIEAIKKGREKDKKVIEDLQKKVDAAEGARAQSTREQIFDAVDAEFAKMPAAVKALIGEGTRREIEDGSLQHTIRKHILKAAEQDQTPGLDFAQKMHKAARALAPGAAAEAEPEEAPEPTPKPTPPKDTATGKFSKLPQKEREEAWSKAGAAKPTNRESPLPKGERLAMQTARKIMVERGMLDEMDAPDGAFLPSS